MMVAVSPAAGRAQCLGDFNADGKVTIDELMKAVNRALSGCQDDGICRAVSDELAACQAAAKGQPLKTGQTNCYDADGAVISRAGTGQDGERQDGLSPVYVDNGDGTISDMKTGLMWEKLSDDGSVHDKDTMDTWDNAFAVHVAGLNTANFAGHNDWRMPNVTELVSLAKYGTEFPAVNAAFNTNCGPGCTVLTCSCTVAGFYWSSTTFLSIPANTWVVDFSLGGEAVGTKSFTDWVRAVRGGV